MWNWKRKTQGAFGYHLTHLNEKIFTPEPLNQCESTCAFRNHWAFLISRALLVLQLAFEQAMNFCNTHQWKTTQWFPSSCFRTQAWQITLLGSPKSGWEDCMCICFQLPCHVGRDTLTSGEFPSSELWQEFKIDGEGGCVFLLDKEFCSCPKS